MVLFAAFSGAEKSADGDGNEAEGQAGQHADAGARAKDQNMALVVAGTVADTVAMVAAC